MMNLLQITMTSLASRKLHTLVPRMMRAGVTSRNKGMLATKMFSPVLVRGDLARMVVGGQRLYTTSHIHYASALPVENTEEEGESVSRVVKSQQEELLDRNLYKLDMDVRRTGRALTHDLARIVRMIELSGICTANQALLVLRCCGDVLVDIDRESRIKLAETYANVLKKNGVEFDVSHYNALLRVRHIIELLSLRIIGICKNDTISSWKSFILKSRNLFLQ